MSPTINRKMSHRHTETHRDITHIQSEKLFRVGVWWRVIVNEIFLLKINAFHEGHTQTHTHKRAWAGSLYLRHAKLYGNANWRAQDARAITQHWSRAEYTELYWTCGLSVLKYQLKCPRRIREKVASTAQNMWKICIRIKFSKCQELPPVGGKVAENYCRNSENSIKVLHFELRQPEEGVAL